jgi:hypothetical protein
MFRRTTLMFGLASHEPLASLKAVLVVCDPKFGQCRLGSARLLPSLSFGIECGFRNELPLMKHY